MPPARAALVEHLEHPSATEASSPVFRSTIATSHSSPTVDRAERAKGIVMCTVPDAPCPVDGSRPIRLIMACAPRDYRLRREICKNGQSSSVTPDPLSGALNLH